MKLLISLVSFSVLIGCSLAIVCPPHYCETVDCLAPEMLAKQCSDKQLASPASKFIIKEHSSFCGCCSSCIQVLGEGEACFLTTGAPQAARCAVGLMCYHNKCTKLVLKPLA